MFRWKLSTVIFLLFPFFDVQPSEARDWFDRRVKNRILNVFKLDSYICTVFCRIFHTFVFSLAQIFSYCIRFPPRINLVPFHSARKNEIIKVKIAIQRCNFLFFNNYYSTFEFCKQLWINLARTWNISSSMKLSNLLTFDTYIHCNNGHFTFALNAADIVVNTIRNSTSNQGNPNGVVKQDLLSLCM